MDGINHVMREPQGSEFWLLTHGLQSSLGLGMNLFRFWQIRIVIKRIIGWPFIFNKNWGVIEEKFGSHKEQQREQKQRGCGGSKKETKRG